MSLSNEPSSKDAIASTKTTRYRLRGWSAPPKLEDVLPQPSLREVKPLPIQNDQLKFL